MKSFAGGDDSVSVGGSVPGGGAHEASAIASFRDDAMCSAAVRMIDVGGAAVAAVSAAASASERSVGGSVYALGPTAVTPSSACFCVWLSVGEGDGGY